MRDGSKETGGLTAAERADPRQLTFESFVATGGVWET